MGRKNESGAAGEFCKVCRTRPVPAATHPCTAQKILALLQLVPQRCKSIKGKFEERPNNGRQISFLVLIALLRLNKFHETVFVRPDAFHRGGAFSGTI